MPDSMYPVFSGTYKDQNPGEKSKKWDQDPLKSVSRESDNEASRHLNTPEEFELTVYTDKNGIQWVQQPAKDARGWCSGVNHSKWSLTSVIGYTQLWSGRGLIHDEEGKNKWKANEGIIHADPLEFVQSLRASCESLDSSSWWPNGGFSFDKTMSLAVHFLGVNEFTCIKSSKPRPIRMQE